MIGASLFGETIVKRCRITFLVVICLLGWSAESESATIAADTCSSADVAAAVALAANGDTVVVPDGTCTWSGTLTIAKAVTLQGQGIGRTIILDAATTPLIRWGLVASQTSRMTGIEFRHAGGSHPGNAGVITFSGSNFDGSRVRVDHCKFDDLQGVALVAVDVLGVFDHNTYIGTPTYRFVNVWHKSWNGGTWGDRSWTDATGFGTENFLFVEDNDITFLGLRHYAVIDAFGGARYVFRYNTVTKGWTEAHGTDSGGRYRGTRAVEIYNNTFVGNDDGAYIVNLRSSVAVIHHNSATGFQSTPRFELASYRVDTSHVPFGRADGSNAWDRNSGGVLVHSLDQPCVSGGSEVRGDTPVVPWSPGQNNQVVDACYEWNNTEDGADVSFMAGHANIQLGVHFFQNTPKPGYVPYTYPHPLTTGEEASEPQAPTNLRVISSPD